MSVVPGPPWEALIEVMREAHPALETLVLTGSHATGRAGPHSDVDLLVVGPFASFERLRRRWNGWRVEAMQAPWTWYQETVSTYERHGNIGTVTDMVAHGILLFGDNAPWRDLQALARMYWARGPEPPSSQELEGIRERLSTLWGNLLDTEEPGAWRWLHGITLTVAVDAHFRMRGWWAVKPKYQWETLGRRDARCAQLVQRAAADQSPGPMAALLHYIAGIS